MHKANVNDRASVEALYPREAFAEDAGRNALNKIAVLHGVRIESAPDREGWFGLARARHHVGEAGEGAQAIFLAAQEPHLAAPLVGQEPESAPSEAAAEATRADEYDAFVDRIIETARTADFPESIGRDEPRLKGFHGG